ncbi:hypothetical protein MAPG_03068 [Magnaporthiopsis poae ATCC 64411]|uniref:Uncharacterized protein n=1 Tax=Magnaporthiopsis poae (strain ATCC 64411 / 73-15) TaxID=644358 RepID=A0A0C4DT19_MAGP6|nr:hypothetical protein MAPG_03068 [Magnaporthiopsis poae ATCC 64411]
MASRIQQWGGGGLPRRHTWNKTKSHGPNAVLAAGTRAKDIYFTLTRHAEDRFQTFFPGWSGLLTDILKNNCTAAVQNYQNEPIQGLWSVVDCVLGVFSESRKVEATAAALTLGLTPTILQVLSASSAETSLLFLRRPVLALLIAASSIAPSNAKDSFYANPDRAMELPVALSTRPWLLARNTRAGAVLVSAAEYSLAGLAAGNVAFLAYQLGHWNFLVTTNSVWDPMLMTYAALLTHLIGVVALLLRFKAASTVKSDSSKRRFRLARWLCREGVPAAYGADGEALVLSPRPASILSLAASWVDSIAPTLQVLFSTISLSGSLFMNQVNARECIFRYFLSAVAARLILSYELAGMREACQRQKSQADEAKH